MDELLQVVRRVIEFLINFFIRFVWPVLLRIGIAQFWSSLYALAAIWTGWGTATERIAFAWASQLSATPIPTGVLKALYPLFRLGAFFQILFGWVFWALLTADLLNRMIHRLTGEWVAF